MMSLRLKYRTQETLVYIIQAYIHTYMMYLTRVHVLGRHGSVSLCRDERENKMAATYMY